MSKYSNIRADKRTTFTTMDGKDIHFVPFSWDEHLLSEEGLKQEYRDRGQIVDCPQYTVTFATGTTQKFDHNETTIKDVPPGTPENEVDKTLDVQRELWLKYQADYKQFQAESQAEMANLVYVESLADYKLPEDTAAWEARLKKKHIAIPTDPEEKRQLYISTELVRFRADQIELMATVTAVSMGATREADVEIVKRSFLDTIWSNGKEQLAGREATGKAEDTQIGKLDGQSPSNYDQGQETVAINE
jgi:hypothetical protein